MDVAWARLSGCNFFRLVACVSLWAWLAGCKRHLPAWLPRYEKNERI